MVLQKTLQASENPLDGHSIVEHEMEEILYALAEEASINPPEELMKNIREFFERNKEEFDSYSIHESGDVRISACCPRCLKAHILNELDKLKIDGEMKRILHRELSCNVGHNGYYIDKGALKKIK